jgi:hypothetical protein
MCVLAGCLVALGCWASSPQAGATGAAAGAPASEGFVRVEAAGTKRAEALPGGVVTVLFRVENARPEARGFDATLALPDGWQPVLPVAAFTVAGASDDLRMVSFRVPEGAPPGSYEVRFRAEDQQLPTSSDEGVVLVTVSPTRGLDLQLEEGPRFALAGRPYRLRVLLLNEGNTEAAAVVRARDNAGFAIRPDSIRVALAPRSVERVTLEVAAPAGVEERLRHVVRIEAYAEGERAEAAHLGVVTDVVPPDGPAGGGRPRLPAEVAVRGVGGGAGAGLQLDATASGPLWGGTVDAAVTLPGQRRTSFYREWSRYSLRYSDDAVDVYAGDQVYALTPLTQTGQYGFGGGARVRAGHLLVGGYYSEQRHTSLRDDQGAAFVGVQATDATQFSLNALHRRGHRGGDAATVRALVAPNASTRLDAECGLGVRAESGGTPSGAPYGTASGKREGRPGGACSAQFHLDRPWISTATTLIHTEASYPGLQQHGLVGASSRLVLRPARWVQLEATTQRRRYDYEAGDDRDTWFYRVGGGVTVRPFGHSAHLFLYHRGQRADFVRDPFPWDRRESSLVAQAGYTLRRAGVRGSVELGRVRNQTLGYDGRFQRYRVSGQVSLGSGQAVSASVEHFRGKTVYRRGGRAQWQVGLSASLALAPRTSLTLTASGFVDDASVPDASDGRVFTTAQGRLRHTFPSGHRLELDGRGFIYGERLSRGTSDYRLAYVVPVGVPVGAADPARTVAGRVYDAETGAGLAGVVLTLDGVTALTDAEGRFRLPRPETGAAYLHVDRISAGLGRVPLVDLPIEVRSEGEADAEVGDAGIEIPMVRGASLAGRVSVADNGSAASEAPSDGVRDAVLELRAGEWRLRAISDREGRFSFSEVPPGAWTLRVLHARLPDYHRVEREAYAVPLAPGQDAGLEVRVVPERRRIRVIESGTVLSSGRRGEAASPREQ